MQKYIPLLLLIIPLKMTAQKDTMDKTINFWSDTTWDHSILESDLILKLYITQTYYITDGGIFSGNVMEVSKGGFTETKVNWSMGMIEWSQERYEKRYGAITPKDWKKPFTVYAGFKKTNSKESDLFDKKTKQWYEFYMSEEKLKK